MTDYVARCEQCGIVAEGGLEAVGDAVEAHEQFHDVQIERVATDGGTRAAGPEGLRCVECDVVHDDWRFEGQHRDTRAGCIVERWECEHCNTILEGERR